MRASFSHYQLQFRQPAGTSRGVYTSREVWYLLLEKDQWYGVGECAPLPGLSRETPAETEGLLREICRDPKRFVRNPSLLVPVSSVRFAFESALRDLQEGGRQVLFSSDFTRGISGIPINGLIWMGQAEEMKRQIDQKLKENYHCIKLKIGHLNFEQEIDLLKMVRSSCPKETMTLRVDANGAYQPEEASGVLSRLAELDIHSIEQPIQAGQWCKMAIICKESPVPIALDEELIGVNDLAGKATLLDTVKPAYLVLKPSLHGGFSGCDEWIKLAEQRSIGWWVTSYLESNIGLNAIAQWTFTKQVSAHQGLGTGKLFVNNINSPLFTEGEQLRFNPSVSFKREAIFKQKGDEK